MFGVTVEVVLIAYLLVTSIVGLYTIPVIKNIQPIAHNTSLTYLILNCGLFVVLSSALPLLSKILGITNFDLLGSFGEVKWLGNIYIILLYNAIFAVAASISLFTKFTARVRQEIWRRYLPLVKTVPMFFWSTFLFSFSELNCTFPQYSRETLTRHKRLVWPRLQCRSRRQETSSQTSNPDLKSNCFKVLKHIPVHMLWKKLVLLFARQDQDSLDRHLASKHNKTWFKLMMLNLNRSVYYLLFDYQERQLPMT